jgi:hypothetical protein
MEPDSEIIGPGRYLIIDHPRYADGPIVVGEAVTWVYADEFAGRPGFEWLPYEAARTRYGEAVAAWEARDDSALDLDDKRWRERQAVQEAAGIHMGHVWFAGTESAIEEELEGIAAESVTVEDRMKDLRMAREEMSLGPSDLQDAELALLIRASLLASDKASQTRESGDHEASIRWNAVLAATGAILRPDASIDPPFGPLD